MGVTFETVSEDKLPKDVWKRMLDKVKLFEHLEQCTVTTIDKVPDVWNVYMADKAVECPSCHEMVYHRVGYNVTEAVCIECNGGMHEPQQ